MLQMHARWIKSLTLLLWLAHLSPIAAAEVHESWNEGLRAFQQNDFSGALQHFEIARDEGQSGPAVHYNIAICEYKLGRYPDALRTFTLLKHRYPKWQSLASYNLGLTETKLGNAESAHAYFRSAYDSSGNDEKLRLLAANMLSQTEPVVETRPFWAGSVGMRAGYDDNVALRDDLGLPAGVTTDSPMLDFFGSLQGPFSDRHGVRLDAMAYVVRYLDVSEFDQSALQLGAYYDWRNGDWSAQAGIHGGYGTFSGDGFDRTGTGSAKIMRRISLSSSLEARYRYIDVSAANSAFSGIEGSRQILDARYRWFSEDQSIVIGYQFESNDRADPGVSPQRNRFGVIYRYRPESGWGFELGGSFRNSEYNDLTPSRTEDLKTLRAAISRMIGTDWLLLAQYQFSDNESSDPIFAYQRNQLTLGLMKIF